MASNRLAAMEANPAVDLGLGHQGGHGVRHDDVQGTAAHQLVAGLQGLLSTLGTEP